MKREIKFRVWTGVEMVFDITAGKFGAFYVNPGDKGDGLDPNDSASLTPLNTRYNDTIHVMQFTGLFDCDSAEIYDGDILRHSSGYLVQVSWGHHLWSFVPVNRVPNKNYQDASFPHQFKIVGNIHQTPELLNGTPQETAR